MFWWIAGLAMQPSGRTGGGGGGSGAPNASPVTPTLDPKIQADILYDKPIALSVLGIARIGGSIIFGPYFDNGKVTFGVSFGLPANPNGTRIIYDIAFDSMVAWSSADGGTLPGHGVFNAESFTFRFYPGRLDQAVDPLEELKFPGQGIAYRPQMVLFIENLPYAQFVKPVPYVSCLIGDTTDGAVPHDGVNLGDALEQIAWSPWAGYTSADFESVNITDVVPAVLMKDNFNIVQLCQSITRAYRNIDLVQSDKLRFKDRGSNIVPDLIVTRDRIIASDTPVTITRSEPSAQPRELELATVDPDQDYTIVTSLAKRPRNPIVVSAAVGKETMTLPLVLDASTRQALVTFAQFYEENARKRIRFSVSAFGYEIEPADLFAPTGLADGVDDEVWKVIETTHGANWVVEVAAEAILRCSLYSDIFVGATFDPETIAAVTLSGDNLVATNTLTSSTEQGARVATVSAKNSGKYYFEMTTTVGGIGAQRASGIGLPASSYTSLGNAVGGCLVYHPNGQIWSNGVHVADAAAIISEDWIIRIAADLDNRKIWFGVLEPDGTIHGDWNDDALADPTNNVGGVTIPLGLMVPFCTFGGFLGTAGQVHTANFGSSFFASVVPPGFTPGWPP